MVFQLITFLASSANCFCRLRGSANPLVCLTYKKLEDQVLTLDGEDDPFTDGGRDPVAGDAEVSPHLSPGDPDEVKNFPLKTLLLCKTNNDRTL